ncbi:hypothetical protein [Fimbriimonas ginsengisoli]|uniref:DUF5060 domain-containing protein n=1 Tax=Fimbriimonas ginsengisoli Gsoil 348 TaxID=661478 RepID=A0A068NKT7_FIMGI|nr:hypothetical protein [Fimbriimonas ginsengisoli]AIE83410.1 hypothetical protein OP10G_0042 [Fimbriimonas ginsengisoli Gsoil 348]
MFSLVFLLAPSFSPSIGEVRMISGPARPGRISEWSIELSARYRDPFDAADMALDGDVITPSGKRLRIPGFLYRPYRREIGKVTLPIAYSSTEALRSGAAAKERTYPAGEILTPSGPESWRVRFTPTEAGSYRISFVVRDHDGTAGSRTLLFRVAGKPSAGFVRIDPSNPRGFRLTTGQSFFPLGANIGWAGERGTRDYDDWLPNYASAGANWGRVWLSPGWTTFALEKPGQLGFDLANAWRLDCVLSSARAKGIRLALCIDSYNVLCDKVNWPEWERSPFNRLNGGVIDQPSQFWSDPETARRYRNKLRYLVARWGADPAVFGWEFWNEVDGVTGYQVEGVREWHRRMGAYLRTIDPYRHLISTSFGGNGSGAGDATIFSLPELDYSVSHLYEAPDAPLAVSHAQRRLGALGKPHFVAEAGADTTGPRSNDDPTGLQLHDPLWASLASGASGGSMLWWWDSYIHPRHLYPLFRPAADFMNGIDWGREALSPVAARPAFLVAPKRPLRRDIRPESGPADWSRSELNRPKVVRIDRSGAAGGPVAGLLHGTGNHPDLHNPITFRTDLPWPTRFAVEVGDVSGYGGAALRISLDGKSIVDEAFPDPDGDRVTDTLKKYAGDRIVEIPPGGHTVIVENLGQDWVKAEYRFEQAGERTAPALIAWAVAGPRLAIAWVRQEERTWRRVAERKIAIDPVPPSRLIVTGISPGRWSAEVWDTWKGGVVTLQPIVVGPAGEADVRLPKISSDIAVKLRRESAPRSIRRKVNR